MLKKLLLLALLCGGLHLIEACFCRDAKPYFDFKNLAIEDFLRTNPSGDTLFTLQITPDDLQYFASGTSFLSAGQLLALSCIEYGENGLKDPVVDVDITADRAFTPDFPAGTSLKPLFRWNYRDSLFYDFPVDTMYFEEVWGEISLRTTQRPDSSGVPFRFTVSVSRGSGSTLSGTSLPVTW